VFDNQCGEDGTRTYDFLTASYVSVK